MLRCGPYREGIMGLLIECPECKKRNSHKVKSCKCGFILAKFTGRVYWIDYLIDGQRHRERIGPNKEAAEQRYREVLSARAEGRHIKKSPDVTIRFKTLAEWYLQLPEVKAKRSWDRDRHSLKFLLPHFGERLLKDITPAYIEAYRHKRLAEPSRQGGNTKPATVNREIACLKTIFNKAMRNGKAERNPVQGVRALKENNERDRILSPEEYIRLLAHCPGHLKPIVKLAYHTGMRRGEILGLTWGQVDLKEGFIKLTHEDTKTNEGRLVPLNRELIDMFRALPQGLPHVQVFTRGGKPVRSIRESFTLACQKSGIENLTFHDLRHTAINNWRLQGHDYFRIMAATGHKTMTVFKRYNTVSREELKTLVEGNPGANDTYNDTKAFQAQVENAGNP
jgi:integrase